MDYVLGPIVWMLGAIVSILLWVLGQLFWIMIWLLLPLAIVAFVALRLAEHVLGQEAVRGWVKAQSLKFGSGAWTRARRLLFALGVLPARVLFWFAIYAVWHSLVSLLWKPSWSPWARAWSKRWRPKRAIARAA